MLYTKEYIQKMIGDLPPLVAVAKGLIPPEALTRTQQLKPGDVDALIDAIVDQSTFLQKITVQKLQELKVDVNVLDIEPRQMVRVPQGKVPADEQLAGIENIGKQYDCKDQQLFFSLKLDVLRNNQNNPKLEGEIENKFSITVGNDILDLAWNGDETSDDPFLKLNNGWLKLAEKYSTEKVGRRTHKVTVAANANLKTTCNELVLAIPDKYAEISTFIFGRKTKLRLIKELGIDASSERYFTGKLEEILGYPVTISTYMPDGAVAFTPITNLAWGVNTNIDMFREFSGRKRAIEYTFDCSMDFEIAINDAFAWATVKEETAGAGAGG